MRGSNEPLNPLNVIHIEHLDFNGGPVGATDDALYDALKGVLNRSTVPESARSSN